MSKKYYAWKNRECQGINPEWIELTGKEFVELCKANKDLPDEEKRWFYKLPGLEEGDDYLVFECTKEKYLESQNEKEKRAYKVNLWDEFNIVSLDYKYTDISGEEYSLGDLVADPSASVEDEYLIGVLYNAINHLEKSDKEFVLDWIEMKNLGFSDMEAAELFDITFKAFRYRFSQICKLLKNFF